LPRVARAAAAEIAVFISNCPVSSEKRRTTIALAGFLNAGDSEDSGRFWVAGARRNIFGKRA
jgi:hypothetical protein